MEEETNSPTGHFALSDTTKQFKKQLPHNLFLQILSFVVYVGIGVWLVPYLVKHLGRAAYGLIPIAGVMTQYVSLISHNISSSVNRFLTIALRRNDVDDANRVFNTAFFSYSAIAVIQVPMFGLLIYYANAIFTIPDELYRDAIILLICSATAFLINLTGSVFSVPIYANNRLDISRSIDIGRQVCRLVGIVAFFLALGPALRYVGYVDLAISVVLCVVQVGIGKRLAPVLKLALHYYDWHKVRQLINMGWWLLVNHIGALLFLRTDIWVCNRFVSAEAAGDYAAIFQWSNLIRVGGGVISGIIAPMIMIYYARAEMENIIRLSKLSVRILSLALAIPISVMCVFSSSLLHVWLGDSFGRLAPLMIVMLCHLVINVGVSPLFNIQLAMNKVRWPGLVTLVMGIINLFLAILFAKYLNWGIYGVAIAGAIILTIKNAFFTPIYGAVILHQPWYTFLKSYLSSVLFLAALVSLGIVVSRYAHPTSWMHLALISLTIGTVGLAMGWFILPKRDRRLIIDLVPGSFRSVAARFI